MRMIGMAALAATAARVVTPPRACAADSCSARTRCRIICAVSKSVLVKTRIVSVPCGGV